MKEKSIMTKELIERSVSKSVVPSICDMCHGRGWYNKTIPNPDGSSDYYDQQEAYCDCPRGELRRETDK